jgi:hypothetical protein
VCQLHELAGWERGAGIRDGSMGATSSVGEDSIFSPHSYPFAFTVAWLVEGFEAKFVSSV